MNSCFLSTPLPLAVMIEAVKQLSELEKAGMVISEKNLTSFSYDSKNDFWVLRFGGISVNVRLFVSLGE